MNGAVMVRGMQAKARVNGDFATAMTSFAEGTTRNAQCDMEDGGWRMEGARVNSSVMGFAVQDL